MTEWHWERPIARTLTEAHRKGRYGTAFADTTKIVGIHNAVQAADHAHHAYNAPSVLLQVKTLEGPCPQCVDGTLRAIRHQDAPERARISCARCAHHAPLPEADLPQIDRFESTGLFRIDDTNPGHANAVDVAVPTWSDTRERIWATDLGVSIEVLVYDGILSGWPHPPSAEIRVRGEALDLPRGHTILLIVKDGRIIAWPREVLGVDLVSFTRSLKKLGLVTGSPYDPDLPWQGPIPERLRENMNR